MAKDRDPAGLESRRRDLGSNAALAPGQVPGDTVTAPSTHVRVQPIEPITYLSAPHGGRSPHDLHAFCTAPAHPRVAVLCVRGQGPQGGIGGAAQLRLAGAFS